MKKQKHLIKSQLCSSILLALGLQTGQAFAVDYGPDNNFTMLSSGTSGGRVGGTNLVDVTWDGTLNTDVGTAVSNMTIASTEPFFGLPWAAHDVTVYGPGTYVIDTCIADGSKVGSAICDGSDPKPYTMNVAADQIGVHMLFDWGCSINIDVINVWNVNAAWGFGPNNSTNKSVLEAGDDYPLCSVIPTIFPTCDQVLADAQALFDTKWLFTATDPDGNGVPGTGMNDGPFVGFNAAFNIRSLGVFQPHNDSVFTIENESVVTVDVLANDELLNDPSGFAITVFDTASEKGGGVTDNGDNTYTYLPPVNFMGIDSFNYTVSDGILTGAAKVEVVVLSEAAAAVLLPQLKGATTSTSSSTASGESGGVGATGLLAIPLMLLLLPQRLFTRKK